MTFNELIPVLQLALNSQSTSLLVLLQEFKHRPPLNSNRLILEYSPEEIEHIFIANHKYGSAQIPCRHCGKNRILYGNRR
jgi:predicted metalloenzyme YecM